MEEDNSTLPKVVMDANVGNSKATKDTENESLQNFGHKEKIQIIKPNKLESMSFVGWTGIYEIPPINSMMELDWKKGFSEFPQSN